MYTISSQNYTDSKQKSYKIEPVYMFGTQVEAKAETDDGGSKDL
jgi:hypothetical protein